ATVWPIIMATETNLVPDPISRRPRAILFDAGNTLLQMNYSALAEYLGERGHRVVAAQVEDGERRARVRLDRDLASGLSTESRDTHGRSLGYVLEHLGIVGGDEVDAIGRWRQQYNAPVGLWNRADPVAPAALSRVKEAGLIAGVISNSNGTVQ